MQLAAPSIGHELSACDRDVWLENLRTGATASLVIDGGAPLELGKADWPAQFFTLPPGFAFTAGSQVQAMQQLGSDTSAPSSDRSTVQSVPSPLPQPVVVAPVLACAAKVYVTDLVGGATVTVFDANNVELGSQDAQGWTAAVTLQHALNGGAQLEIQAEACGSSSVVHSPPAIGFVPRFPLPSPTPPQQVFECQRILEFTNLLPGTLLRMQRADKTFDYELGATTLDARIDPPLGPNESLTVQVVGGGECLKFVTPSPPITLTAAGGPPPAPSIDSAVCPGSRKISVGGLIPSAELQLMRGSEVLLDTEVGGSSVDLDLAGIQLAPGQRLAVRQRVCPTGDFSAPTPVPAHVTAPATTTDLQVQQPVAECGLVVRITGVAPGSFISITSAALGGGRIGHAVAGGPVVDVAVAPRLLHGDTITVAVDGCASASATVPVQAVPDSAPQVTRALDGEQSVDIAGARPGSIVDVFVDDVWAGSAVTPTDTARVHLRAPLRGKQTIFATCRFCDSITTGDSTFVHPRHPALFLRATTAGIRALHDDRWKTGRVQAIMPLDGGRALVGTESSGLWIAAPVAEAEPLSELWTDPADFGNPGTIPSGGVRCLARDVGSGRLFAGTSGALWYTDTTASDPLRTWVRLPGIFDDTRALLVLPNRNAIVAATGVGVRRAPLSPWPPAAAEGANDPGAPAFPFWSLAEGPDDSVVAYGVFTPGTNLRGTLFVGEWLNGGLGWVPAPITNPADPDANLLSLIAGATGLGALASAPSDRRHVYLAAQDAPADRWFPILHSGDGGRHWELPSHGPLEQLRENGDVNMGHQADRNLTIDVHPTKPATVLIGGCRDGLIASTDGAKTWDTGGYPDFGNHNGDPFHPDVLVMFFDQSDPSGNTVWVGSDGGLFRSADMGKSWDEAANRRLPTVMFDPAANHAASLSASPDRPDLLVGATQDNGFIYCRGGDERWEQVEGGDGQRAKFVTGDVALLDKFGDGKLHWFQWDGTDMVDRGTLDPPVAEASFFPDLVIRVPHPSYRDDGHLMVALAGSEAGPELFGLFDAKPGSGDSDRFAFKQIAVLAGAPTALGTWDGTTVLASFAGGDGTGRHQRVDTATGDVDDCATTVPKKRGAPRWMTFLSAADALAVDDSGLLRTDLQTWSALDNAPLPSTATRFLAFAVDPFPDPPTLYAGDRATLYASSDWGATWREVLGLPGQCVLSQVEYVAATTGERRLSLATWNWSAWVAALQ